VSTANADFAAMRGAVTLPKHYQAHAILKKDEQSIVKGADFGPLVKKN
jgi:hypothetical protein